jgi:hypothetical protein
MIRRARTAGGFSETINLNLTKAEYQRHCGRPHLLSGTEVQPDYYQVRVVVRERGSGNVGSFSVPGDSRSQQRASWRPASLFLFATDAKGSKTVPVFASRQLTRQQDLRYVMMVYNAR